MVLFVKMHQRVAHATSLAAVIPMALSRAVAYSLSDSVDWQMMPPLAVGMVVGVPIGTILLRELPQRVIRIGFAIAMAGTATRLLVEGTPIAPEVAIDEPVTAIFVLGIAAGITSGLLGVGGGILMVPVLALLFSIPLDVAKGTSLAALIPAATAGTIHKPVPQRERPHGPRDRHEWNHWGLRCRDRVRHNGPSLVLDPFCGTVSAGGIPNGVVVIGRRTRGGSSPPASTAAAWWWIRSCGSTDR